MTETMLWLRRDLHSCRLCPARCPLEPAVNGYSRPGSKKRRALLESRTIQPGRPTPAAIEVWANIPPAEDRVYRKLNCVASSKREDEDEDEDGDKDGDKDADKDGDKDGDKGKIKGKGESNEGKSESIHERWDVWSVAWSEANTLASPFQEARRERFAIVEVLFDGDEG